MNAYSAWWQGNAIERLGYPGTLLLDAGIGLVGLAVLPLTRRGDAQRGIQVVSATPSSTAPTTASQVE